MLGRSNVSLRPISTDSSKICINVCCTSCSPGVRGAFVTHGSPCSGGVLSKRTSTSPFGGVLFKNALACCSSGVLWDASCCSRVRTGSQAIASAFACSHSGFDMGKGLVDRCLYIVCGNCCTCWKNGRNRVFIDDLLFSGIVNNVDQGDRTDGNVCIAWLCRG